MAASDFVGAGGDAGLGASTTVSAAPAPRRRTRKNARAARATAMRMNRGQRSEMARPDAGGGGGVANVKTDAWARGFPAMSLAPVPTVTVYVVPRGSDPENTTVSVRESA